MQVDIYPFIYYALICVSTVAPYGQEDIDSLRSIFEMSHLRTNAVFLDTQCKSCIPSNCLYSEISASADRMPVLIGEFISRQVYNNKLRTVHHITTTKSCVFVDVANGKEQRKGSSWMVKFPAICTITSLTTRLSESPGNTSGHGSREEAAQLAKILPYP
jgi:hypothetical protein